jgi:competence protein ComEC
VLNKELPFLHICLPLSLGIITGYYFHPVITVCVILLIIFTFLIPVTFLFNKRLANPFFGAVFYLTLFFAGILLFRQEMTRLSVLNEKPSLFSGLIADFPEEKENSFLITVKLNAELSPGNERELTGSIILYNKKDSVAGSVIPGDSVLIKCTPVSVSNRGNPYEFDYRFYMASHGIKYYAFTRQEDFLSIKHPSHIPVIYRALIIRNRIIEMFRERGITGRRLALVSAITLGEKSHLDPDQKQYFINAGIMHIMAVSGLHAVILSYFIFSVLFFLKGRFNILRIIITLIILWAFAFITGLTPSVLRATIMFSFLQAGKLLKRPVNPLNSVLASVFILILIRPSVIFDAGFLLSYAAVFYIIIFYRDLYLMVNVNRKLPDIIWQSAAVTITAQAGTLPLTIMLFNRFPTWFILTNVIIVPVSSVLIITGCLVPLTFPLVRISGFIAVILDKLTWLTEFLTEKAASLPLSTIDSIGFTATECILLTASLTLALFYILKKKSISVIYPLAAFLLFSVSASIKYLTAAKTNEIIVYNSYGGSAIGLRTGRILNLYTDSTEVPKEVARHCAVLGLKVRSTRLSPEPVYAKIENHTILIMNKYDKAATIPEGTDLVIFTAKRPFPVKDHDLTFPEGSFVITTQYSREIRYNDSKNQASEGHTWAVVRSGAYCKRL